MHSFKMNEVGYAVKLQVGFPLSCIKKINSCLDSQSVFVIDLSILQYGHVYLSHSIRDTYTTIDKQCIGIS